MQRNQQDSQFIDFTHEYQEVFVTEVLPRLPRQAAGRLARTCRFFREEIQNSLAWERDVAVLLDHVARGEQDQAELMLKQNPELILARGTVTDYSGRRFESISAFEYVLWALDVRYMASMMLSCIPKGETGQKIKSCLIEQYNRVTTNGVTYTLNGESFTEKNYDMQPLNDHISDCCPGGTLSREDQAKKWKRDVSRQQILLPAHFAQQQVDSKCAFQPDHDFKDPELNRSLKIRVIGVTNFDHWYDKHGVLATGQCAVYRGRYAVLCSASDGMSFVNAHNVMRDYNNLLGKLYQQRLADRHALKLCLDNLDVAPVATPPASSAGGCYIM